MHKSGTSSPFWYFHNWWKHSSSLSYPPLLSFLKRYIWRTIWNCSRGCVRSWRSWSSDGLGLKLLLGFGMCQKSWGEKSVIHELCRITSCFLPKRHPEVSKLCTNRYNVTQMRGFSIFGRASEVYRIKGVAFTRGTRTCTWHLTDSHQDRSLLLVQVLSTTWFS